jgi:hypothetical protein
MKTSLPILLLAVVFGFACSAPHSRAEESWSLTNSWKKLWNPDPKDKKVKYQTPTRVVALWAPAMYNAPGKPAARGFGGRLYFYNAKDQAVPVEGQLTVYGFNDSTQRTDGRKPDRKFVFTAAQLATHYSPAELGASYSIWIPWDAVGGPQMEVSLLPVFTAVNGQVVMGEQSRNLLPGTTTAPANSQQQQNVVQPFIIDHRVAPASYAAPDDLGVNRAAAQGMAAEQSFYTHATQPAPQENIRTTSIQLTRGIAERLILERAQQQNNQQLNGQPGAFPQNNQPQNYSPATTYPLPAGSMPPNMTFNPGAGNVTPHLAAPNASRSFNAPTADSRSWGPTVQRMQAPQHSPGQGQTPVGQSPTRYAPGSLPVPATAGPLPTAGPPQTQPGPAAPGYLPPGPVQSIPAP